MYKYTHFTQQNTAPSEATAIGVYDGNGKKIMTIPLGRLTPATDEPLYSFGLLSDIHLYKRGEAWVTWNPEEKFGNALTFFENKNCVFCIQCGDYTQTGLYDEGDASTLVPDQFEVYKDICDSHTIPVYGICGNHESYVVPITNNLTELKYYTGTDLYYTVTQGNDMFVFLGQPSVNAVMGDDAFAWLTETLEKNTDRRCFVFVHSYIEEDSGDATDLRENSIFESWGIEKTNAFMELLRKHPNILLFHGHSHMKFESQKFDKTANYTERNGFKSVHVPSCSRSRDVNLESGTTPEDMSSSEGYIVDVYDDYIILNGWDFMDNVPVPLGTFKIAT